MVDINAEFGRPDHDESSQLDRYSFTVLRDPEFVAEIESDELTPRQPLLDSLKQKLRFPNR